MNYKTIYVVNYKETTKFNDVGVNVSCGTCELGYNTLDEAIAKVGELTDDVINNNLDLFEKCNGYRDSNDNGDCQSVTINNSIYEYWVSNVDIEMK